MSCADDLKAFAEADERDTEMLSLLLAKAKARPGTQPGYGSPLLR